MKILIVDDEVIIRTGLASVIAWNELGLRLLAPAASAEEALERMEAERPDILLTDIRMKGKTGLQLAEEARLIVPDLEVIILSGYGDFAYTQQAIRQGVGDYLLKTSKPEEIIKAVMRAKQRLMERRAEHSRTRMLDSTDLAGRQGGKTVLSQEEENTLGSILLDHDPMALKAWTQGLADELAVDPECTPESFKACLQSAAVAGHRWLERTLRAIGREGKVRFAPWLQEHPEGTKLRDELFWHLHGIMNLYHTALGEGQTSHVQRAKAYIESCPAQELSLQQVAAYVHLHPGHLSELFKKETGSAFGDYVTGRRMRRAMDLLAVSPAKVSEIAAMSGYEDVKYFSRLFKKHTGKTPSEFREEVPGGGMMI